jgi:glucose/arabinose dehydrogenase
MMDQKPFLFPLVPMTLTCLGVGLTLNACSNDSVGGGGGSGPGTTGTSSSTSSSTSSNTGGNGNSGSGTGGAGNGGTGTGTGGMGTIECDEPGGTVPPLKLTEVARGLDRPLYMTSAPGDTSRLYVLEQTGKIRLIKDGVLQPTPFIDVRSRIETWEYDQDEKGLLGLAFHPAYQQNGRFFLYYNRAPDAALTLVEFARSPDNPDVANSAPSRPEFFAVSEGVQTNHNGGMLAFGPDGMLYVGLGDGGGEGDPDNHGQNINIKLAKILRINVDTHPTAPAGNLPGGDPDIWDYGLRNPWRFSFDGCTGDLYIGDVGQRVAEEINIEPRNTGKRNYGWSIMEGTTCFDSEQTPGCSSPTLTAPVKTYGHGNGDGSVTGGYVYRGSRIPALRGTYVYGDFSSNRIWTLVWKRGDIQAQGELSADLESPDLLQGLASFGEDAAGELYVVNYAAAPGGRLYRIDPE